MADDITVRMGRGFVGRARLAAAIRGEKLGSYIGRIAGPLVEADIATIRPMLALAKAKAGAKAKAAGRNKKG